MSNSSFDAVVVGGGLVGCAVGRALALAGRRIAVLEAEPELARHQSGRNSGVIHSGLYYRPGSFRARFTVAGREALYRYVEEKAIPFARCGKLVVASEETELPRLDELERRGRANGLAGLRRLGPEAIREIEPAVVGLAGLLVPETGIVDFAAVNRSYAADIEAAGSEVRTGARVLRIVEDGGEVVVETTSGELRARRAVNCAGLQADRLAHACGAAADISIVPFRGDYYYLRAERSGLVSRPIYPVPDPAFPFLGVHLTTKLDGRIEAGPNAVLALAREGYSKTAFRPADAVAALGYPGLWRLAARHWRTGLAEVRRSFSRRAFARALRQLVPSVEAVDLSPGGCGVRAQAMRRDGTLVDDFHVVLHGRTLHVLNTPSPAATGSLAIGDHVAAFVLEDG
jgi:L-2-hydroxyglutarate oxidase